jgi:hypothetical protein
MREVTRQLMQRAITGTVSACKDVARSLMVTGTSDVAVLGLAWSIAQGAATEMRELLERSVDGRALIDYAQLKAAGKKPS